MPKRSQHRGTKGSIKWTQELVNHHPDVLSAAIVHGPVEWVSPLASDKYAEYWDGAFLKRIGIDLPNRSLNSFWPPSGPRWDALGRIKGGAGVILEAKAHPTELRSQCRAGETSRKRIKAAFREVEHGWHLTGTENWLDSYYQYANRLAHAYLLNELNPRPTFLVFLYLIGDGAMNGPRSRAEWEAVIGEVHTTLGVEGRLRPYILDAFVDVSGPAPIAA